MPNPNAQTLARDGAAMLRQAVLEVLYDAADENVCLTPSQISQQAGIFAKWGKVRSCDCNSIVLGLLESLVRDNLVRDYIGPNGKLIGWHLTKNVLNRVQEKGREYLKEAAKIKQEESY